jgi:F-type H+-transporting ATPase subunit epsilon
VTPETTLLDAPVRSLQFPLYDGQAGVLPGRAPVVGRLGYGVLTVSTVDGGTEKFFIEGGFVQVKAGTVTLLTDRAQSLDEIDSQAAADLLAEASKRIPTTDAELAAKERDQECARRMLAVTR